MITPNVSRAALQGYKMCNLYRQHIISSRNDMSDSELALSYSITVKNFDGRRDRASPLLRRGLRCRWIGGGLREEDSPFLSVLRKLNVLGLMGM